MNNALRFTVIVYCAVTEGSQDRLLGDDEASLEWGFCFGSMSTTDQRFAIWKKPSIVCPISTFQGDMSQISFTVFVDDASCSRVTLLFQEHIGAIGNDNPLTAFWMS